MNTKHVNRFCYIIIQKQLNRLEKLERKVDTCHRSLAQLLSGSSCELTASSLRMGRKLAPLLNSLRNHQRTAVDVAGPDSPEEEAQQIFAEFISTKGTPSLEMNGVCPPSLTHFLLNVMHFVPG